MHDAILERVTTTLRRKANDDGASLAAASIALDAALTQDPATLSSSEAALLREWLRRLSTR